MTKQNFKQGDIIVQTVALCTETFAVYGGAVYKSNPSQNKTKTKCNFDYSLALYYLEGETFDVDIDNGIDCGYVIGENQLSKWRTPTDSEMKKILRILEQNSLAYDFDKHAIRKLKAGEKIGNNPVKTICNAINHENEKKARKLALKSQKKGKKGKNNMYNLLLNGNRLFHNIFGTGNGNLDFDVNGRWEE